MSEILSELHSPSTALTKKSGKTVKLKTFLQSKQVTDSPSSQRKSLQQLQPSAQDEGTLVGKDGFVRLASQKSKTPKRKRDGDSGMPAKRHAKYISKPSKKFPIYTDSTTKNKREGDTSKKVKTAEEISYELMVQEEIPERYWKEIAEERRIALQNTLKENEQLHSQIEELKEENVRLKVTADQAVYLAGVVQELLGEAKDDKESSTAERLDKGVLNEGSESDTIEINLRIQEEDEGKDSYEKDERIKNSERCSSDEDVESERMDGADDFTEYSRSRKRCRDSDSESDSR